MQGLLAICGGERATRLRTSALPTCKQRHCVFSLLLFQPLCPSGLSPLCLLLPLCFVLPSPIHLFSKHAAPTRARPQPAAAILPLRSDCLHVTAASRCETQWASPATEPPPPAPGSGDGGSFESIACADDEAWRFFETYRGRTTEYNCAEFVASPDLGVAACEESWAMGVDSVGNSVTPYVACAVSCPLNSALDRQTRTCGTQAVGAGQSSGGSHTHPCMDI
eukprot:COSAG02_NODE_17238_length_1019_cov_1.020652_3_plen_221_part_01